MDWIGRNSFEISGISSMAAFKMLLHLETKKILQIFIPTVQNSLGLALARHISILIGLALPSQESFASCLQL